MFGMRDTQHFHLKPMILVGNHSKHIAPAKPLPPGLLQRVFESGPPDHIKQRIHRSPYPRGKRLENGIPVLLFGFLYRQRARESFVDNNKALLSSVPGAGPVLAQAGNGLRNKCRFLMMALHGLPSLDGTPIV